MARARNPRRIALDVIKAIKNNASVMVYRWSHVPSLNWRRDEDGKFIHERRTRAEVPASEYRENDPEEWARLVEFMRVIERQAAQVAEFARRQEREARARLHAAAVQRAAECASAECGEGEHLCR